MTTETIIEDLRTMKDVVAFCKRLLKLKKQGPRSVRFLVAITTDRSAVVREPMNGKRGKRSHDSKSMDVRRDEPRRKSRRKARPVMR